MEPPHTHRTTHTSVPPAHTWNQSVDTEPGLVLSKMQRLWADDLFTGRRKAGYHIARSGTHWCWCCSHCQMDLFDIQQMTADDSKDMYKYPDRLQADSDSWNANVPRSCIYVLYSDCIHRLNFIVSFYFKLAQLNKGPILSEYLGRKLCQKINHNRHKTLHYLFLYGMKFSIKFKLIALTALV